MGNREFRAVDKYEIRQQGDGNNVTVIEGYIAKFDSLTELWEGYFEKIDRSAFENTLKDGHNIFLLYHHDWSKPLASTKTGTLELEADNIGLRFKATINNNLSYAKDTVELIKEGLIEGCSFSFNCVRENVEYNSNDDSITRTLLDVNLYEGSVLCIPQYEDTMVFTRAKELVAEKRQEFQVEKDLLELKTDLELINIENELL